VEGVTATIVVFALVLVALVAAFIRENHYQDDCDWDDDRGNDALDAEVVSEATSSSDDWEQPVGVTVSGLTESSSMNDSYSLDFDNSPRPCFDLVSAYDELGELGMNSVFHDSFSDSGAFNSTGMLHG